MSPDLTERIKSYLSSREEIMFAYIFGSFVRSEQYHDIDIAVYVTGEFDYKNLVKHSYGYESGLLVELNRLLRTDKVDLVLLNTSPPSLTSNIINTGKLLFDKDKYKRIEFENRCRKEYIDLEPVRRIQDYYLKSKLGQNA